MACAWGDRPGSYDGLWSGNPPRQATGPPQGHRGPVYAGYGWPRHRSSVSFYAGIGPGVYFSSPYAYPYLPAAWSYGYAEPTGIYYNPAMNHVEYYLPPVYAPAELTYGPLAMERFLGLRREAAVAPRPAEVPPEAFPKELKAAEIASRLRKSNEEAKERGRRFMSFGDALFLKQRCHEAVQRYKSAIEAAPDLVDAYVREGFALIAIGQYALAAKAFKIALHLEPGVMHAGFRLDDIYGDNRLAKTAHLEALAQAALDAPDNADLVFLVGMVLHADGDELRAQRFFQRALDLAGPDARFLAPLLGPTPAPGAIPAKDDAAREIET